MKLVGILAALVLLVIPMGLAASGPDGAFVDSTTGTGSADGDYLNGTGFQNGVAAIDATAPYDTFGRGISVDVTSAGTTGDTYNISYVDGSGAARTATVALTSANNGNRVDATLDGSGDGKVTNITGVVPQASGDQNFNVFIVQLTEQKTATAQDTVSAAGGEITNISLNADTQTKKWQGFTGQVTGTVSLKDAAGVALHTWAAVTAPLAGSNVYFSTSNVVPSVTLNAIDATDMDTIDGDLSFTTTDSDSFQNTFSNDGGANYQDLTLDTVFVTEALTKTATGSVADMTSVVFRQSLQNDATGYDGSAFDFEVLVPYDATNANTYYVFVELV